MSQYPELDAYISKAKSEGVSDEELKKEMLASGYNMQDVFSILGLHVPGSKKPPEAQLPSETAIKTNTYVPKSVIDMKKTSSQSPPEGMPELPDISNAHTLSSDLKQTSQIPEIQKNHYSDQMKYIPNIQIAQKSKSHFLSVIIIILLILVGGFTTFAYFNGIGFLSNAPYDESNITSGLLSKVYEINTAKYTLTGSIVAMERESDAEPFNIKIDHDLSLKEKYYRDSQRASFINEVTSFYHFSGDKVPSSLNNFNIRSSIKDPLTDKVYDYKTINNSNNFQLIVEFETSEAIFKVKSLKEDSKVPGKEDLIKINGQKVMFAKGSPYLYLSSKPPNSIFKNLSDTTSYLPPDTNITAKIIASIDKTEESTDFQINASGEGYFGDISYKIDIDLLKKLDDFYFRVNNFPLLSIFGYSVPKGEWLMASSKESEIDGFDLSLKMWGEEFGDSKETAIIFFKKAIKIADDTKLIKIKNTPKKEKINGQTLYRYDLGLTKDSLLDFIDRIIEEKKKSEYSEIFDKDIAAEELFLKELKSETFSEVFDYHDKNTKYVLWVDKNGFPVKFEVSIRMVPDEEKINLKDKQFILKFGIQLDDINSPINIERPSNAKKLDELFGDNSIFSSTSISRDKGREASLKGSISSLRAEAEIVYDETPGPKYGYGTVPFSLGICTQKAGTLFGDENVFKMIRAANEQSSGKATCVSILDSKGVVSSYAVSIPLVIDPSYSFCVDSTGVAIEILGKITGPKCK